MWLVFILHYLFGDDQGATVLAQDLSKMCFYLRYYWYSEETAMSSRMVMHLYLIVHSDRSVVSMTLNCFFDPILGFSIFLCGCDSLSVCHLLIVLCHSWILFRSSGHYGGAAFLPVLLAYFKVVKQLVPWRTYLAILLTAWLCTEYTRYLRLEIESF